MNEDLPSLPVVVIVNGNTNDLSIHLANHGKKNYTLVSAAASFHDPEKYWATVSPGAVSMHFAVLTYLDH
jgi:hypothetical protein